MARQTPVGKGRAARATGEANNGADARGDRRTRRETAVIEPGATPNGVEGAVATAALPAATVAEPAVGAGARARGTRVSLEVALYALLGLLALLTRFFDLGSQALHHDESLHALYSWMYYVGQGYQHDPLMHGPFLFHVAAAIFFLVGDSDASARYGPALFSSATVLLPYLLRRELGRRGALLASLMLLVSPSFLYFGRFIRHDVYSAFWTLLLFAAIMRFIEKPRPAWAFTGATAWAFLFTNKEDFFIVTAVFGSALAIALLWRVARSVVWAGAGLVVALGLVVKVLPKALGWKALPAIPWENPTGAAVQRYATALLLHPLVLSALLLLAAFAIVASSLLKRAAGEEGWLDGLFGHDEPGTPVAACHALLRDQRLLGVALGIAAAIYVVLYTSLFTHIPGILSGSFGAIGYWLAQHDVQRAEQPWFYYLLLLPQYDPLAAFAGGIGVALTGWRLLASRLGWGGEGPQPFARGFIAYWAVASVAIYSWAGEKMPWMVIHLVLPLTLLAAALLGAALDGLCDGRRTKDEERGAKNSESLLAPRSSLLARDLVVGGLILAAALAWFLGAARLSANGVAAPTWRVLYVPALAIVAVAAVYATLGGWWRAGRVAALALGAALLLFHVHAGWALAYQHGDVPQDMLVYVQTSPDVTRVMREIDLFSAELTGGKDLTIMYDDNTSWPFQWYLRDYPNKQYFSQTLSEPPAEDVAIVLVGNENLAVHPELANALTGFTPQAYSMRWHFPEDETYRPFAIAPELSDARNAWSRERPPYTPVKVARSVLSSLRATARPDNQARLFRLLAYRELGAPLGSYDFTIYVRTDLLPQYNTIRYR